MCPMSRIVILATTAIGLCQVAHAQTEFPPAYNNQAHYAVGDLVTDYGNIYRCEVTVTKPYLDPSKTYSHWELFYVRNNTTIPVGIGQTFPTLTIAWNYVRNCRVAMAAYLHLNISSSGGNYTESFSAPLSLDHNSGSQVSIIGDDAANISLNFPNSTGLSIDSGHSFASVSNITLSGGPNFWGVYAGSTASILNLNGINITGFDYQIYAEQSSKIVCGAGMVLTNCHDDGCYSIDGASVTFNNGLDFTGNNSAGAGLDAENGGRIYAVNATITSTYRGALATYGGIIQCNDAVFTSCFFACLAEFGGNVSAEDCTFTNSGYKDLVAIDLGLIDALDYAGSSTLTQGGGMIYTTSM